MRSTALRLRPLLLGVLLVALLPAAATAQFTGLIFDGNEGTPIAGATIAVLDGDFEILERVASDPAGRFTLTVDGAVWIAAELRGWAGQPVAVPEGDTTGELLLPMYPRAEESEQIIETRRTDGGDDALVFGFVKDARTGDPLSGATVALVERGKQVLTQRTGRFAIDHVEPGVAIVKVQMIGYGEREIAVPVGEGGAYQIDIPLSTEAIELEGLNVTTTSRFVARRLLDAYARADVAPRGRNVMKEEIESRAFPPIEQILRGKQSLRISRSGPSGATYAVRLRNCAPSVWVDGIRVARAGDDETASEFLRWPTYDVEMIEVFPGPATLPAEFNDPGTFCAIAIWTRRGG